MLILAYRNSCPYCREFEPTWAKFKKRNKNLEIRDVDVTQHRELSSELGVTGVPSIILLHKGKKIKFEGKRTISNIEKFVKMNMKK